MAARMMTSHHFSDASSTSRQFEFKKRRQLFIGTHNQTLSVAAMRVSSANVMSRKTAQMRKLVTK